MGRRADEAAGRYPPDGSYAKGQHTADNAALIRPTCIVSRG